ncbi:metal ABC transporter substrate-binding protein [uncultured Salinisphaera sp.]|uniref:metal ABC transporter substrate-binding protein n=1 Tax=uncultured Salinisphaera sp. TaxID=359372 RepID=UPI0032B2EF56
MGIRRWMMALLAVGCWAVSAPTFASDEARFKVATTFTILADMARNVAGEHAQVVSITRPGAEIHDYSPTPQDIVRASDADLILYNGFNLERWFEQFLNHLGDVPSATLSDGVRPIAIAAGDYEGMPNPHAWMGLEGAEVYVDNIRDALIAQDPDHAQAYRDNAAAYKKQIRDTIEPLRERIGRIPESQRWLVSCEGAFSYLARDFGMKELYLWPINAERTGTPQQVRKVVDGVRQHDIPAVFCESTVNNSPARQVARDTGAHYGGVLYVDSLSKADGPVPTYLDLLRVDAQTIADGLHGRGQ